LNNKTAIEPAQLRQLLNVSNVSLLTSITLAAILAFMLREVIASPVLQLWCFLMVLASLLRAGLITFYQRYPARDDKDTHVRLVMFRLIILLSSLVWGSAGFLLFPANDPQHQMFLIFMLAGLTAGGVVSFAPDLLTAIIFSVSIVAPLMIRLFIAADSLSEAMGMAAMLYLGFIITSLRRINQNIIENINLRLEASAREDAMRASEERYRLLLSYSPVGIFHYDTNFVITYCNDRFADIMHNSIERIVGLDTKLLNDQAVIPTLKKVLEGEKGYYEGHYHATFSDADVWVAMTCAPSRDGNGNIVGGIAIVQDITERKMAEEEINHLAYFDHLTQLPNRRLLLDRLKQTLASSRRSSRQGALLLIDLDNFKSLNDTLGHDIGDMLLQQVAERLAFCVRESDTVARLGGDEFVLMLEDLSEQALEAAAQTEAVGEKILATLSRHFQLAAHEYRSTSSIGATLFMGNRHTTEELLKQADIAMYQAKKAGRNTLRFFDQQMQDTISARVALESELRTALEKQQFQLYYQIQVDTSHRPLGAEALIRWLHPQRGLVSPAQFIPLSEETGLILPIGHWVLETACAQLKAWQQSPFTRHLVLAVNVSAKQFHQADFVAQVQAALQQQAINPRLLKLELTESLLLEDIEDTIVTMTALNKIGVQFSLDDFGTGYSSLQYLKRLPLDQLKIDQSFVCDIVTDSGDKAVVHAIIAMADSLNLDVIAEGVETEEQRQLLLSIGCDHFQGYLFGKPIPIDQFDASIKQG
jgi:diguanylate cyclase (GGDEF)-like protein/PAS domain S-box-containing protein